MLAYSRNICFNKLGIKIEMILGGFGGRKSSQHLKIPQEQGWGGGDDYLGRDQAWEGCEPFVWGSGTGPKF